jgi:hypothetical protein
MESGLTSVSLIFVEVQQQSINTHSPSLCRIVIRMLLAALLLFFVLHGSAHRPRTIRVSRFLSAPCDSNIPGYWTGYFPGPLNDEYLLNWTATAGQWSATYINPVPNGWTSAVGRFNTDNSSATITFNTGLQLTGTVDASCSTISWDNDSVWKAVPPVPCSAVIPGPWSGFDPQPTGADYSIDWTTPPTSGAWTVTYLNAPVGPSWTAGSGQLSADNTTATVLLNSGQALSGIVSGGCSVISWNDGSIWKAAPKPPVITDVHIVAMNHLDVGYNGIPVLGLINNIREPPPPLLLSTRIRGTLTRILLLSSQSTSTSRLTFL